MSESPAAAQRPLTGRGILVTGGGSGIGLAVARRLLEEGAAVTIVGRSAERLADATRALTAAGADPARIRAFAADLSDEDFLVGPGGAWITGQVISVDGGQTVSRPFDASAWVEPEYGPDGMRGVV